MQKIEYLAWSLKTFRFWRKPENATTKYILFYALFKQPAKVINHCLGALDATPSMIHISNFFDGFLFFFFCYKTDSLHQTAWLFAIHHTIIFNLHNTHNIAVLTYCHPSFRSKILASFPTGEKSVSDSTLDDCSNEILYFCQSILCTLAPLLCFISKVYMHFIFENTKKLKPLTKIGKAIPRNRFVLNCLFVRWTLPLQPFDLQTPYYLYWKILNPSQSMLKVQEACSILRMGFALSKSPHLHRAYFSKPL